MPPEHGSGLVGRHESVYEAWGNAAQRSATFDPTLSPLYEHVAFVVGAPRSGTTWLQQLLLVHPLIATGGESHLFCEGLPSIFDNFAYPDETSHLSTWVAEEELLTAARALCDTVFVSQRNGARPDATVVLEKTPNHRMQAALQSKIYPDARYVHIVRDGRDVAASQHSMWKRAAAEYNSPRRVAQGWADSVRDIQNHFKDLAYIELRYEDIVRDTPGALATIFEHLRLPYDTALCEDAAAFGDAPVNTAPGSVTTGVRKHEANVLASHNVAVAAGDLLVEFGYATEAEVAAARALRNRETLAVDAREAAARLTDQAQDGLRALQKRWRKRAKRKESQPVKSVTNAFATALAAGNPSALADTLAPSVRLDDVDTPAADAAAQLVDRLASMRAVSRRASEGYGQITLLGEAGARHVVRLQVTGERATSVDVR